MSLFGKVMIVIALLWSFVAFLMLSASEDVYSFMRNNFVTIFFGYIIIIVVTIVSKKIVASM